MRVRFFAAEDGWGSDGANILAPDMLEQIASLFEESGPIVLKHWFYRGACAPQFQLCSDMDAFQAYLKREAHAGDAIDVWALEEICRPELRRAEGKCPDDAGRVPQRGAY